MYSSFCNLVSNTIGATAAATSIGLGLTAHALHATADVSENLSLRIAGNYEGSLLASFKKCANIISVGSTCSVFDTLKSNGFEVVGKNAKAIHGRDAWTLRSGNVQVTIVYALADETDSTGTKYSHGQARAAYIGLIVDGKCVEPRKVEFGPSEKHRYRRIMQIYHEITETPVQPNEIVVGDFEQIDPIDSVESIDPVDLVEPVESSNSDE